MQFQALGTLQVLEDGEVVDLGPRKQRLLLALLLAHANEVVSTDRILADLWGDDAPGKENALWVAISRLRSALEPARVERGESTVLLTRDHGYMLAVDEADYDVARFERLVANANVSLATDPGGSADALDGALGLWRGPMFDGLDDEGCLQAEVVRVTELRINALEDRIDADLARGLAGELVSELEYLRQEHPFRERLVEQLMLSLYRSGRPAEALRAYERFRRMIGEELGIDPSPSLRRLEEQILLHDENLQRIPTAGEPATAGRRHAVNPFKGLLPFSEADAQDFFGRNALIAEMVRAIGSGQRLLAVVGASGSGKSSVVRAGLIPALAKGAVSGSDEWLIAYMVPGAHPFAEAEAALLRSTIDAPASLDEQLRDGDAGLLRAALRVLPEANARIVLVIDQFEELFTLVDDEEVQRRFLSNLVTAIDEPHGRVSVVVTLRADLYERSLSHPKFGARLSGSVVNVTPLTPEELGEAAIEPARRVGVSFEPALLGELIHDVGTHSSALPLFQYALTELFEGRAGDTIQSSTYHSMGGVQGALTRRADHLYEHLDSEEQETARQLFLRLVVVSPAGERSRRRVEAAEIVALGVDTVIMQRVIGEFGRHRLLSFDADHLTGAPTVEVAHEALLTAWPRLQSWIDESRDDLRRHASLTVALREWELADHNPDYLLAGSRLVEYGDWSRSSAMTLTTTEREFLDEAFERRDGQQASELQRQRGERRARRRLWSLIAGLAVALGIAALFLFGVFDEGEGPTVAFFGIRDDGSWNANIAHGLDRATNDFDMVLVDAPPVVDPGSEFRELAASGPDIIITDSLPTFVAPDVFGDFPDVRFGVVDGAVDSANTTSVSFANEQGAFLAGAAAALKSETGTVGFIGGSPAVVESFRAGFEGGAQWIDPEIRVLSTFIEQPFSAEVGGIVYGFVRPDLGRALAVALYERGADVVFHAAGFSGFGLFTAAVEQSDVLGRHLWAVGVDNDQWFDVDETERDHVLTSVIKRGDVAAYLLAEQILSDEPASAVTVGLADGAFDYSTQGDGLNEDMVSRLDEIKVGIADGTIVVPKVAAGEILNLDPTQNAIEEAFSDIAPEQIAEYLRSWVTSRYTDQFATSCSPVGSVLADQASDIECAEFLIAHLDEYLAEG